MCLICWFVCVWSIVWMGVVWCVCGEKWWMNCFVMVVRWRRRAAVIARWRNSSSICEMLLMLLCVLMLILFFLLMWCNFLWVFGFLLLLRKMVRTRFNSGTSTRKSFRTSRAFVCDLVVMSFLLLFVFIVCFCFNL